MTPTFPSSVTIGQTARTASLTLTNASGPPESAEPLTVSTITLVPSCGSTNFGADCPLGGMDPGVLLPSASAVGRAGTACAGVTFSVVLVDAAQGKYQFVPSTPVVLGLPGTPADTCVINFTFDVAKSPAIDANPGTPGLQTRQLAFAVGDVPSGSQGSGTGSSQVTVNRATPALSTTATNAALGGTIDDTATLSGAVSPTGSITFTLYALGDTTCTGTPVFTATKPVAGNGSYQSASFTPAQPGAYRWIASYSGDANNLPASGACGDTGETSTVSKATPALSTTASASTYAGGYIVDYASLAGGSSPSGTITFSAYGPDDATCTGSPVSVSTVAYSGPGTASTPYNANLAGTYRYVASYSGDASNSAVSGACNDAGESVVVTKRPSSLGTAATSSAKVGSAIDDRGYLGGVNPTGTITFNLYGPGDATCTGTPVFTSTVAVDSGSGGYTSAPFTTTQAGTYRWVASYSGDANNTSAAGACGDSGETSTVSTASPSISTSATSAALGSPVHDTATLAGGVGATGTITFDLYGPGDQSCIGAPVFTSTVPVGSGNGSYDSASFTPAAPGAYHWVATYSGDANNDPVAGLCGATGETSTVAQATPSISTTATDATVGGSVHDTATLAGGAGATGTVTFDLYGPGDATCTGTPVFTSTNPVAGNGSYDSSSYTPAAPGTYRWIATYSGDANNAPAAGACGDSGETSTVAKATPSISTSATDGAVGGSISDTATIAGGVSPGGTVSFAAYAPGDSTCTGTPVFTSTKPVSGNGDYVSADYAPSSPGAYRWIATYDGDANNASAAGACGDAGETSTVGKDSPSISTSATGGSVGGSISDTAAITAGSSPGGSVTFDLYGPGDPTCTGSPVFTSTKPVNGNSDYDSAPYTPTVPGSYRWIASYSGDANNAAAGGACGDAGETSTVGKATPVLSTSATGAAVGRAIHDTATVTGPGSPTGAVTFTVHGPDDATCATAGTAVAGGTPSGGQVRSADFTPSQTGAYRWIAHYAGDANNVAADGSCNDAGETSTVGDPRIAVAKGGPSLTHAGDAVTFTFAVTNPGAEPVHAVTVTDDKCSAFSASVDKKAAGGAADGSAGTLDPGDSWTFSCSMTVPDGTSLTNTATARAKDANEDDVPAATASHTTKIIHPDVSLSKSGPAGATAGSSVPFTLTVRNPGDTGLPAGSVAVTDPACTVAPKLAVKQAGLAADTSQDSLDPGDTWTYGCSVQTRAGDTQVTNTATVVAADQLGKTVNATASATTPLSAGLDTRAGTSDYLTVPAKCVTKRFRLDVKGTSIASVQFAIDGRKFAVRTKPGAGGMWSLSINPLLRSSARHKLTALVTYTKASGTASKTLSTTFKRCACVSRRAFDIRLRNVFHAPLRSASVYLNGKRVRVLRGAATLKAPIGLVGLPKGRFVVRINAVRTNGRRVSATRAYLTCAKKRSGSVPKI